MPSLNALLGPPGAAPARWPRKLFLSPPAAADEVQARRPARRWDELKPLRVVAGRGPWAGASGPSERRPNGGPQGPEEASDAVSAARAADRRREARPRPPPRHDAQKNSPHPATTPRLHLRRIPSTPPDQAPAPPHTPPATSPPPPTSPTPGWRAAATPSPGSRLLPA